eukprot:CAMPEP_0197241608 /NCGR_PEP_ID=MMETSP1429-20130617/7596_1 /TAXON_ID=49237 /ORGANISM="Chaetoceros  sp., Strain UNC1202" /LENGTH=263 /DNA_ID=CAMNT_0042701471 /DNA_START=45 /DNA_END=836 /DNA_ORIENTATION=+
MSTSLSRTRTIIQDILRKNLRTVSVECTNTAKFQSRNYHQLINRSTIATLDTNCRLAYDSSQITIAPSSVRAFSDKTLDEEKKEDIEETPTENDEETVAEEEEGPSEVEKLEAQVKEFKDQFLRSLAEQENIRRIAKRDVDNARSFAVASFAKSLLDTSDNLSRAMDAVPDEYRKDTENHPVLATLYEGIQMTDDGLTKAFTKNGLKKFGEAGDKFDPNMHEALFEYPDENMEAGSIGQVMKAGFSLNDRVIRPAEVGVTKKP